MLLVCLALLVCLTLARCSSLSRQSNPNRAQHRITFGPHRLRAFMRCSRCCAQCAGGQMRIIALITFSADIHKILDHIGVEPEAPRITPARGPPPWEGEGAPESQEQGEGVEAEPDWDLANQSAPDYPDDQRPDW